MTAAAFGFVMGFFGSMPLTGPIAVLVFHRGLFGRYREGLAIALGCGVAEGIYCGVAVAGFGALLERYEELRTFSRAVSALLLLGLGIWFLRSRLPERREEQQPLGSRIWLREFGQGFAITILNPVIVLNWSASIAVLYSIMDTSFSPASKALFAVAAAAGIVCWFACGLAILRRFGGRVPERAFLWLVRGMGGALILLALWLAYGAGRALLEAALFADFTAGLAAPE